MRQALADMWGTRPLRLQKGSSASSSCSKDAAGSKRKKRNVVSDSRTRQQCRSALLTFAVHFALDSVTQSLCALAGENVSKQVCHVCVWESLLKFELGLKGVNDAAIAGFTKFTCITCMAMRARVRRVHCAVAA